MSEQIIEVLPAKLVAKILDEEALKLVATASDSSQEDLITKNTIGEVNNG